MINSIFADIKVLKNNKNWSDDSVPDEHYLCFIEHEITILEHTKATVLISCQGTMLMTSETNRKIVERRWSMTARDLKEILP